MTALLLFVGGVAAGVVNAMAGGGSLLTVPLLVFSGLPGSVANGSNRVGVAVSNFTSTLGFRSKGVDGLPVALRLAPAMIAGAVVGALAVSRLADDTFETALGFLLLPMLVLTLRKPTRTRQDPTPDHVEADANSAVDHAVDRPLGTGWPLWVESVVFFAIGVYGGAFQAGVGLLMLAAFSRSHLDLVVANSVKVLLTLAYTLIALPIFIANGDVDWGRALVLAAGFAIGGWLGARLAVSWGEKLIRPLLALAVVGFALKLLGVF